MISHFFDFEKTYYEKNINYALLCSLVAFILTK